MSNYFSWKRPRTHEYLSVAVTHPAPDSRELPMRADYWAQNERTTMLWWTGLCGLSLLNVVIWLLAARVELPATQYRSAQLTLSGIYVAVCAFRSAFPRIDLERFCLWDTPLSSIFTGRVVATLAEVCFAVQCALFLSKLAAMTGRGYLETLSVFIVPVVVMAQLLCWYAVVTLN